MSTRRDPLASANRPERPFYQLGVLLDAQDFTDEQNYHRGRLARALAYLHGSGTAAGLQVVHQPPAENQPEELLVEPGLAIDRLGRLIELPRSACIRLARWFDDLEDSLVNRAYYDTAEGVVADIFIRFAACENGKTPSFAAGPFDALDAFAPSRLRDAWRLEIVPRTEHPDPPAENRAPLPVNPWARFNLRPGGNPAPIADVQRAILQSWRETTDFNVNGELNRLPEHGETIDPTSLFLARVTIRTDPPAAPGDRPVRIQSGEVLVDNLSRPFALPVSLLSHLLL